MKTVVMQASPRSLEQSFLEIRLAEPVVRGAHAEAEASVAPVLVNHVGRAREEPARQGELQPARAEEVPGADEVQRAALFVDSQAHVQSEIQDFDEVAIHAHLL